MPEDFRTWYKFQIPFPLPSQPLSVVVPGLRVIHPLSMVHSVTVNRGSWCRVPAPSTALGQTFAPNSILRGNVGQQVEVR
mgnify:CR=1 FL=1